MFIIIDVELLEIIRACLNEHEVQAEIVLDVALIAIARKVFIINVTGCFTKSIFAIAAFNLVKRSLNPVEIHP